MLIMDDRDIIDDIGNSCFAQDKYLKKKVTIMVLTHKSIDTTMEFLYLLYKYTPIELFNLILIDNNSDDGSKTSSCLVNYYKAYNNNFEEMVYRVPDISKIEDLIGPIANLKLDEMIKEIINHFRGN